MLHPDLKRIDINNALEALRCGTPLTAKEKAIHEKGHISVFQQIHGELDAAVFEACGWLDRQEKCRADATATGDSGDVAEIG